LEDHDERRVDARTTRGALVAPLLDRRAVHQRGHAGAVHALLPLDYAAAQGSAGCVAILSVLWTVYFAADLFATDCASGQMSTRAMLPVGPLALWGSKVTFPGDRRGRALAVDTRLCVCASDDGRDANLAGYFEYVLQPMVAASPLLLLLGATGVLCSMIVDSALVAMMLALIWGAALAGMGWMLMRASDLAGLRWGGSAWNAGAVTLAALLVVVGAVAFAHGQRHMGRRHARVRVVLCSAAALIVTSGASSAIGLYRHVTASLDLGVSQLFTATGSPDGRYIAIEAHAAIRGNAFPASAVWMARPRHADHGAGGVAGDVCGRDDCSGYPLPWDDSTALRVIQMSLTNWGSFESSVRRARADGEGWTIDATNDDLLNCGSRLVPAWAEVSLDERGDDGMHALRVRLAGARTRARIPRR
jgi:hypothetical protein